MTDAPNMTAAEDQFEILFEARFPARADRLKLVRGSVRTAAHMCGFTDTEAQNIVLAVDEACQNIIVHGYKEQTDGEIVLSLRRTPDGLFVQLRDFAPPVDPTTVRPRALDDVRPGKLGSHFIREIMDSMEFHPSPDGTGNLLIMIKKTGTAKW